ncbi:MAG TPA: hypothetical protein VNW99_12920 [Cytophagaceae bacterium]|jgi:hypothetical protein|nr:hypothetical protein [Cytophagaceae bacterium]
MKKIYFIFLLILCSLNFVFGQNYLNIKNTKTGVSKIIENDKTIFFKINGDSAYNKGVIQQIKDSSIVLYLPDEDESSLMEYKISEFAAIRKVGRFHSIIRIISAPLFIAGGIELMAGTLGTISPREIDPVTHQKSHQGPVLMVLGTCALGLGILPYLIKARTYEFRKDFVLEVKNN